MVGLALELWSDIGVKIELWQREKERAVQRHRGERHQESRD